jgi:hypothetical protein
MTTYYLWCVHVYYLADCKGGHSSLLLFVFFVMRLSRTSCQEVEFVSPPRKGVCVCMCVWDQQASSEAEPDPQEAVHTSSGVLQPCYAVLCCMNKPSPACERLKEHRSVQEASQLGPLRPARPLPTQWLSQLHKWVMPEPEKSTCPAKFKLLIHGIMSK